jgi:hypothetical protein
LFTTDNSYSTTPMAIKPLNDVDALHLLDGDDNLTAHFNSKGWLGINTELIQAPLHIKTTEANGGAPLALFENAENKTVFSLANNGTGKFSGKAYYTDHQTFDFPDSLALVTKGYVDSAISKGNGNYLVNPREPLDIYVITLPAAPKDGMECHYFFGGTINSGVVVKTLAIDSGGNPVLLSASLPQNIQAGDVLSFTWFSETGKWYRKQ